MQPYHLIPRSPLQICHQMTDQHAGKWKRGDWHASETAANCQTLVNRITTGPPYLKTKNGISSSITSQPNRSRMLSFRRSLRKNHAASSRFSLVFVHRLYFTLKKKAPGMSVTVSPCDLPIEWTLAARTLKDKPLKNLQCEWTVRPQTAPSDTHLT